jgi:hypothetical protein
MGSTALFLRLSSRPIVLAERQRRFAMDRVEHRSARMVMLTARSWVVRCLSVFAMAAPYNNGVALGC